jgi:GT2 family glycosyltransferase/tetratricopeptide (TPR) repeat protein
MVSRAGERRGLELYAAGECALAANDAADARACLEQVCALLPAHGAAHHLLGKALARLGEMAEAERLQRRSCALDRGLGWNAFALGELLEQRGAWLEAAEAYRQAVEQLPQEGWIADKRRACHQRALLGGENLRLGLGPMAYSLWCEQLEPRLPSALEPLQHTWLVLAHGDAAPPGPLPVQGWLVLLGPGAQLRPRALQALEHCLQRGELGAAEPRLEQARQLLQAAVAGPLPDLLSCDEDRLDATGQRCDPWFKPAQLAESSWSTPWLENFSAWRFSWLREQGLGWPPAARLERQAWLWRALALQPVHQHLPLVLVHGKAAELDLSTRQAEAALLRQHLAEQGEAVMAVHPHPKRPCGFEIDWALPEGLSCTAIVPTRDRADLLEQCLSSVTVSTAGSGIDMDWIVVDNGSVEPATQALLKVWQQRLGSRLRVIRDSRAFNWSLLNNRAAQASEADLLLFLNNDIEACGQGWLERMATQAIRPQIGCVGAVLLYPDGSLQHAGVVVGLHGGADHAYRHLQPDHGVHRGRSSYLSDWGAVTGACLMVERSLFERSGGFDPALPVEFNDVEFCLRLGQHGYRHVVDPRVQLVHHESQSRDAHGSTTAAGALALMQRRWAGRLRSAAPWWPPACSPAHGDGRPLGLEPVVAPDPQDGNGAQSETRGHVDHLWQLGPGRFLVSGWSSDRSSAAALVWIGADGRRVKVALGPVRLRRPEVGAELGLASEPADFGFLVAVQALGPEGPEAIELGISRFSPVPEPLGAADSHAALQQLVDACHWAFTPAERLPLLLEAGLGQGLRWLRERIAHLAVDPPPPPVLTAPAGAGIRLVLELNDDPQLARCRLWQLRLQGAVEAGTLPVLLRPSAFCLWGAAQRVPAWLQRLLEMVQLDLPLLLDPAAQPHGWMLVVGADAPPALLGLPLEPLLQACAEVVAHDEAEKVCFRDLPGVSLLRADGRSQPDAARHRLECPSPLPLFGAEPGEPAHPSRRSWLRSIDRWLAGGH